MIVVNDPSAPGGEGFYGGTEVLGFLDATIVPASWLTSLQQEVVAILAAAGLTPDETGANMAQLLEAADILYLRRANRFQRQVFAAGGTWTAPAGVTAVRVTAVGGGGAGGGTSNTAAGQVSAAAGGNSGVMSCAVLTVAPGEAVAVTVGAGGVWTAGVGGNGGASSFGTLLTAAGGNGAGANVPANPTPLTQGAPYPSGLAAGDYGRPETIGAMSIAMTVSNFISGGGGDGPFGGGGVPVYSASGNGNAGRGYGAGGSGGATGPSDTAKAGGYGAPGLVIVEW